MTLVSVVALALTPVLLAAGAEKEVFDLTVTRIRVLRNQPGVLHVDSEGVAFRSSDGKTTVKIQMKDLREYRFRAAADVPVEELAQFLATRVHRPVVGHYPEASLFQVAAYHRRTLGGTHGTLEIGQDAIRFVSDTRADSRTWLYRDIE